MHQKTVHLLTSLRLKKKMSLLGNIEALFTNEEVLEVGDIEAGSTNGHVSDKERNILPIGKPLEKIVCGGDTDAHDPDVDKWASSLARILEDVPTFMCKPANPGRISRIPENLRKLDEKAYEPYFLSIGPYHHDKPRVQHMEKRKRFVLKCVLQNKPEITLKDYLTEIGSIESAARSFYSDVKMSSENFVQMLLLDSMFILPLFCGMPRNQEMMNHAHPRVTNIVDNEETDDSDSLGEDIGTADDNDTIQTVARSDESEEQTRSGDNNMPRWFWTLFQHDIFLLENQLPFFVLQKLYSLAYGDHETKLLDIMKVQVSNMLSRFTILDPDMVFSPTDEVHHLLHLCHKFFRPTVQQESPSYQHMELNQNFRLGSAVQLYESGVRFETTSGSTRHSLLDVTFGSSGKMSMPSFLVDGQTGSLLRNLIALEQMKYPSVGLNVSAYAVLLLHLVTTPEDVELLRRKGIIQHHLASDKEMMYLINKLSVGLAFDYTEDRYSLKPVFQELKKYSERRLPKWRAWLKHRYFRNPWTVVPLFAASLLLLLTIIQTYYAVYSHYHPIFYGRS